MSFPTTSIIDTFNRANENPLATSSSGTTWTTSPTGGTQLQVSTNAATAAAAGVGAQDLTPTYGPDSEAYFDASTIGASSQPFGVWMNVQTPGAGTESGYEILYRAASSAVRVFRVDTDTLTQLGADISATFSAGDGFGASNVGGTITPYQRTSGTWNALATRTDSTYGAGKIAAQCASDAVIDNFGGGTVAAATATPVLPVVVDFAVTRAASY